MIRWETSRLQQGPQSKVLVNGQNNQEGVLSGWLSPAQKEDEKFSESSRLEYAPGKPWRVLGLRQRQCYLCAGNFNLLFFLTHTHPHTHSPCWFFLSSSFNHVQTGQMKSETEARSAKAAWLPSLQCPIPAAVGRVFSSGAHRLHGNLASEVVWNWASHFKFQWSNPEEICKVMAEQLQWSIFHSWITKCLFFERWEVIIHTLSSAPNCRVKEVNLSHEGSFDLDVSQQQKSSELWWLQILLLLGWKS